VIPIYFYHRENAKRMRNITIKINNTVVQLIEGDLFKQTGKKAIPFNEFFDTTVDDVIISSKSLNGIYVDKFYPHTSLDLDTKINRYIELHNIQKTNSVTRVGKHDSYRLGTIIAIDDYILTAMSKFNSQNDAVLSIDEYIDFLFAFWSNVLSVYNQENISVPIFGSGITRFVGGHETIDAEQLLRIMLVTFQLSRVKLASTSALSIIVTPSMMDSINTFEIKEFSEHVL
jgi:hypothetical protein